jgi:hypothetical protein
MDIYPALDLSPRWDMIAWNQAASRMLVDFSVMTARERNLLWFLFTDPRHRVMAVDWEREALRFLALFRASTQRYIEEPWLDCWFYRPRHSRWQITRIYR